MIEIESPRKTTFYDRPQLELPTTPWGLLPPRMSVLLLCGSPTAGQQIERALTFDQACRVELTQSGQLAHSLETLRTHHFDAVVVLHDSAGLDAVTVLDAIRTSSRDDQAVLVIGEEPNSGAEAACLESGAEGYLCLQDLTARAFLWHLARASERRKLMAENRQLRTAQEKQRHLANQEVAQALDELREITFLDPDSHVSCPGRVLAVTLSDSDLRTLLNEYEELLQAYVMMGVGTLGSALGPFVERLHRWGLSTRLVVQLHLSAVSRITEQLGPRGSRHVVNRGNVLLFDLLLRLADWSPKQSLRPQFSSHSPSISRKSA